MTTPTVDPTQNVLDLFHAGEKRADDLRIADRKLRDAQVAYLSEISELRAHYIQRLADKESERLDAIRAVDASAVSRAGEVAAAQAATLATQAAQTADALRGQVESARIATETRLADALSPFTASIESLRQAQYQQQGERSATVPVSEQLAPLIAEIRALAIARNEQAGAEGNRQQTRAQGDWRISAAIAGAAIMVTIIIGIVAYFSTQHPSGSINTYLQSCASAAAGEQCVK